MLERKGGMKENAEVGCMRVHKVERKRWRAAAAVAAAAATTAVGVGTPFLFW